MARTPADSELIKTITDDFNWLGVDGIISYSFNEEDIKAKRDCICCQITKIQNTSSKRFTTRVVSKNKIKIWRWQ